MALLDVWAAGTWDADAWVDSAWGPPPPGVDVNGWADGAWASGTWENGSWGSTSTVTPTPPTTELKPIPERIAEIIVARLEGISEGAGYPFTTPSVTRVSQDGREWAPKHNSIVVVQQDQERNFEHDCPGNPPANAYILPFAISGFIRKPEHQEYADWSDINDMEAALRKAIASAGVGWFGFSGYAYNARWNGTEYFRTQQHTGVTLTLEVMYRISELDPYVIRN